MKKVHLPLYTVKIVNIILTVVVVAFAFIASFLENYTMCLAITIVFLIIDIGFMFYILALSALWKTFAI